VLLARDVGLAGFTLRIERIEFLLEALLRRLAGVDGAADPGARWGIVLTGGSGICVLRYRLRADQGIVGRRSCRRCPFRQPEEAGPGPLGAGNVACDPGQRTVGLALELEAVVDDADRVGSPMPFANEARAGFELWPRRRRDPPARFEFRGQGPAIFRSRRLQATSAILQGNNRASGLNTHALFADAQLGENEASEPGVET